MFASIAQRYDLANHALSGGLDFAWRRLAARMVKGWQPRRVLDLATGSGDLALAIGRACPQATIVGADFCEPMLEQAAAKGLKNLVVADGTNLPFADGEFDVVTVAFGLRNMSSREKALSEMARVLRVGGHLLVMDFAMPRSAILRQLYRIYLHRGLPHVAGALTGQRGAYEYLGESIESFPRWERMLELIGQCGFELPAQRPLCQGIAAIYSATRSGKR